jgi:uncharacterized protein YbjT (DUF2867 family)
MLALSAGQGRVAHAVAGALAALPGAKRLGLLKPGSAAPFPSEFALQATTGTAADRLRLLDGALDLVLVPLFDPRGTEQQMALASAARDAGVQRIHLLSASGADVRSPVTLLRWLGMVEREVIASGLPHTILRCTPYMQSIPLFLRRTEGPADGAWQLVGPFRDARFAWLDAADAGAAIARRIETGARDSHACQFSGPEEVAFEDVARILAGALGEPVRYVDICLPEAVGLLEANGFPATRIRAITEYWDYLVSGVVCSRCAKSTEALLGRAPRTLVEYLRTYAAELRVPA